MKKFFLILLLVIPFTLSAEFQPQWEHGDKVCPEASETQRYIEVPVFHDLKSVADVEKIPGLNTLEEMREQFEGAQLRIFYELMNGWDENKKLLIMIPGGPGQTHADLHGFDKLFEKHTPDFLEKFNIIVMDHRGVGCSRPLFPGNEPYQSLYMRQAASDIDLIRRELVGDEKINVWGYSYGSILSQTYALLYHDNVERLMLGGTVSSVDDFSNAGTHYLSNVFSAVSPRTTEKFLKLTEDKPSLREKFLDWAFEPLYGYMGRTVLIPEKVDEGIAALETGDISTFKTSLEGEAWVIEWMMKSIACGELFPTKPKYDNEYFIWKSMHSCKEFEGIAEYFQFTELLKQIKVPTLIYGGAFDHVTPAASMIKMAQKIPNSYIFIDPYMGHSFREKVECFAKLNSSFFSGESEVDLELVARSAACSGLPTLAPEEEGQNQGEKNAAAWKFF